MKKIIFLFFLAVLITGLTGCNTIGGVGKDMSAAGHDVTKAASKVQQSISN